MFIAITISSLLFGLYQVSLWFWFWASLSISLSYPKEVDIFCLKWQTYLTVWPFFFIRFKMDCSSFLNEKMTQYWIYRENNYRDLFIILDYIYIV